jgi:hypothetical protein
MRKFVVVLELIQNPIEDGMVCCQGLPWQDVMSLSQFVLLIIVTKQLLQLIGAQMGITFAFPDRPFRKSIP